MCSLYSIKVGTEEKTPLFSLIKLTFNKEELDVTVLNKTPFWSMSFIKRNFKLLLDPKQLNMYYVKFWNMTKYVIKNDKQRRIHKNNYGTLFR